MKTIATEGTMLIIATYEIDSAPIPKPCYYSDLSKNNTDIKLIVLNTPFVIIYTIKKFLKYLVLKTNFVIPQSVV